MEDWRPIEAFSNYAISDYGRVLNVSTGRVMLLSENQRLIVVVGLMSKGIQHKRSVSRLVANAFLPDPMNEAFDSVLNLDGDRRNNFATNLIWRPRWFVIKYQHQFFSRAGSGKPLMDIDSGEVYSTIWEAAINNGILVQDIIASLDYGKTVWPTGQIFVRL